MASSDAPVAWAAMHPSRGRSEKPGSDQATRVAPEGSEVALPFRLGAQGLPIRDVQERLSRSGFDPTPDPAGTFDVGTEEALRRFQTARQIHSDGVCGPETWHALTDATWKLGDRLLYLCKPMLRGDDVSELQLRLSKLGFDTGRVDGILGPDTQDALLDFQRNWDLTTDGIAGPEVVIALDRLSSRGGSITKASVVEHEALRHAPRSLTQRKILIAERGGLGALADGLKRSLRALGADALVTHHPDDSVQAREANDFGAELFLALRLRDEPGVHSTYWSTTGYESGGGRRLAHFIVTSCQAELEFDPPAITSSGMRHAVLRETRMPAVVCELGPPSLAVAGAAQIVHALNTAIAWWVAEPIET